ncbi:hypothetical protein BKA63DRAFT_515952 [Paraphoma chrysanthemicola]|nr:hypothetical protein BKA63DRAFT_515952 [Paraphoma chrysanthemicola]
MSRTKSKTNISSMVMALILWIIERHLVSYAVILHSGNPGPPHSYMRFYCTPTPRVSISAWQLQPLRASIKRDSTHQKFFSLIIAAGWLCGCARHG